MSQREAVHTEFYREELERQVGAVVGSLMVERTPEGVAPEQIREQWVGAKLPLREKLLRQHSSGLYLDVVSGASIDSQELIPVLGFDAIGALRAIDRDRTAEYWEARGIHTEVLVFRASEGEILTTPSQET